ncbi:DNA mismatch repair protein MutS [Denitratisoma sp. DHT3]|uniref:Smr/MutS family protein n=1 Tax=Denitratisoma sp. DHT3 TaxID=1981880 RepID=UPI0011989990|nr:Smr/MutS family protein [Denitratisoma sp. DHT3]QDX79898.1 DNA mismatch repair protein MutS [Denitratisoma sp. DHT3]
MKQRSRASPSGTAARRQAGTPAAAEVELFRSAVADAVPLVSDRVHHEPPPPPAIPRQRQRDEAAALVETLHGPPLLDLHLEGGDEAAWLQPGLPAGVLRDLRRGRWVVQGHLDLHGHNRDEARLAIAAFLEESRRCGRRCLRIVHGKGLGSPGREPVLKKLTLGWLGQRREVLAFCQARAAEGGAGAVIVLLAAP